MLNTTQEVQDSAHMLESYTQEGRPQQFYDEVWSMLRAGELNPNSLSIRRLYENFTTVNGERDRTAVHDFLESRRRGDEEHTFLEAAGDAVSTSAFSNIIGQITYSRVLDALDDPDLIGRELFTTVPADTQGVEIVPGVARMGDNAEDVGENQEYPRIGLSEEYVTAPKKVKDGFILPITEEAVWEDKTGLVMQRADEATTWLGITWEKELLDTALGITTSYSRNGGAAQATYGNSHTEGDFDNLVASNALVDYTDVETALLAFDDITDPNTGEPIMVGGMLDIVVPTALEFTAARVLTATQIEQGAISASVPRTIGGNPLDVQKRRKFNLRTSQYVKARTSSASTWFIGNFKKAFQYREVWPIQLFRMDRNSEAGFSRDVVTQLKVRRKGAPAVIEPRYVIKCTQ